MSERRYSFCWDLARDIGARKNLGLLVHVEEYRLVHFCLRDVLEQHYGTEQADALFRETGELAGRHFYERFLSEATDFNSFVAEAQRVLRKLGISIFRVEEANLELGKLVLTVTEDLECSGLSVTGEVSCAYNEGFLAGLLSSYVKRKFHVQKVDCWCAEATTCRFTAQIFEV
ncbi:MAG: 4-vinyl reductase [Betaproteobacteria bacterium]|nr:4-vinyl reductase [Betaproteobacteria bacterium]